MGFSVTITTEDKDTARRLIEALTGQAMPQETPAPAPTPATRSRKAKPAEEENDESPTQSS